jgi:hypothetical protein
MCNFFSFCGDNHGNWLYADWEERVALNHQDVDSHTAILTRAKVPPKKQERWSFYEYYPLTKVFATDKAVEGHDVEAARNWVAALDWKTIIKPLVIKPVINPFEVKPPKKIAKTHIKLLHTWASVRASVRASVWASVGDSVWAYISTFFDIPYKYDFSSTVRLWERGLVPSFDGKTWRLHGGKNAKVLYAESKEGV